MRILQVLPELNVGGVETGTIDLARALIRSGHEAYVVSAGGTLVPELIQMGAKHILLPVNQKSPQAIWCGAILKRIILKEKIDIVHARSRVPGWIAYWATRGTPASFITTCHGYYSTHALSRVMGWGKRVIVISHAIGRHMIDDFGVSPEKIRLVHRGVDISKFEFDVSKYDLSYGPKRRWIFGFVGRLTKIKGCEYLIQAFHQIQRELPHAELWLIGDGPEHKRKYRESLERLAHQFGLQDRIKFLGRQRNMGEWLSQMNTLVLPTVVQEGFGRVLAEAGAAGTAVISTRVGGVLDVVDHEQNGLLVDAFDVHGLAQAMLRYAQNPALAKQYAISLKQKVDAQFTLDHLFRNTINVYEEVKKQQKIVVFKLSALGDLILIVPSLRAIKKRFPNALISVVADEAFASVLNFCPYVDDVIILRGRHRRGRFTRLIKLIRQLRKEGFDYAIDFQNNKWTHFMAWAAGIPKRFGFNRGWSGRLLNEGVTGFQNDLNPVQHQAQILRHMGVHELDEKLALWISDDERQEVSNQLKELGLKSAALPLIGLVVQASARWKSKNWSVDRFVQLAERLIKEKNAGIVLIGQSGDLPAFNALKRLYPDRVFNLIGQTNIRQMFALIDRLQCLVTPDSAPMHVAAAFNIPVAALFGPTNPRRHAPAAERIRIFYETVPCAPCYSEKCLQPTHRCMDQIEVDSVYDYVSSKVKPQSIQSQVEISP